MIDVNSTRCNPAINSLLLFIPMFCFGFFLNCFRVFQSVRRIYVGFPNATVTRNHCSVPKKRCRPVASAVQFIMERAESVVSQTVTVPEMLHGNNTAAERRKG